MRLFHSRREGCLFAAGALLGAFIAAVAAGAYIERNSLRAYTAPYLPPKYAWHNCLEGAPLLRDGARAWMTNPRPAPNSHTALCARLVIHGVAIPGATVRVKATYMTNFGQTISAQPMFGSTLAGENGIDEQGFIITDAALDQPVVLDISFSPNESSPEVYTAHTSFVYSSHPLGYPPP